MELHILETGKREATYNMALDEALMMMHEAERIPPVLRLYAWEPPALTIGYTQDWNNDVDQGACERMGVPTVRRITGGGAVFHDHEVTYSIVAPVSMLGANVLESFANVSKALETGLGILGLEAEFAPLNDITVKGKKISGNAQVRRRNVILQHGTILLGLDREKMFSLLRVPDEKIKRKQLEEASERVTAASEELGRVVDFDEAAAAIRSGFEEWSGSRLTSFYPSDDLLELASRIEKIKFSSSDWNENRVLPDGLGV